MLIIDGDYPMAYGAVDLNRNLTLPIEEVRRGAPTRLVLTGEQSGVRVGQDWPDAETMACLPEMRRGRVAAALVKIVARIQRPKNPLLGYPSGDHAYAAAQAHLAYYRILEKRGEARILQTRQQFRDHMEAWSSATEHSQLPVGFVLGLEGADPVLWPEQIQEWYEQGTRVVSLSHYGISTYCHGTGTGVSGGLFPPAKALLKEMDSLGMILDVTHASDAAVKQALDLFSGPLLASHQNCRALVPGERQFPDQQLKKIIQRDGVIGSSMDTWMLYPGANWGGKIAPRREVFPREAVTLEHFVDHIDHVCQLAGNTLHAAIGGDTDGQGGRDGAPLEIDTVADYQKVADVVRKRGYSEDDVCNVMYRNWQRFFEKWLPE